MAVGGTRGRARAAARAAVLTPLDGSTVAERALPYAAAVARALGTHVHLLSVLDVTDETATLVPPESPGERRVNGLVSDPVMRYLRAITRRLRREGVSADAEMTIGDPADEILDLAARRDVALIVIATRGRGGVARLLLGSVADAVMRRGSRPTLLVPPHDEGALAEVTLRRLLVPLDGSPLAETALDLAVTLAAATGAALTLARVVADQPEDSPPEWPAARAPERVAAAYMTRIRDHLPADLAVETVVLHGRPAEALTEYLEGRAVDLVVMATRAHGGIERLALGSTADGLVRGGLPVLVVRSGPDAR